MAGIVTTESGVLDERINPNLSPEYEAKIKSMINPKLDDRTKRLMVEYALTEEEHKRALDRVREYCFAGRFPVSAPEIYLVISQTGGGKSGLTAAVLRENPNVVVIDSDAFKAFNPRADEIQNLYPDIYAALTGPDAYMHRDEVYQDALNGKYNILIEIAPSSKDKLFNINFEELAAHKYGVVANVLAVSLPNSLLSIHERFEAQIESGMANPKLTDLPRALDSYAAVEPIVEELAANPDVKLRIFQRGQCENSAEIPIAQFITDNKELALQALSQARDLDFEIIKQGIPGRLLEIRRQMNDRKAITAQRAQLNKVEEYIAQLCQKKNNT